MANTIQAVTPPIRLRVVLSIAAGLLAEVFTIVVVFLVILAHGLRNRGESAQATQEFMARAAPIVGPVFGVIFTFLMALWVVRKARGRYMAHALLVAAGAIVVHVVTTLGAPGGYRSVHAVADVLKLVAGAIAAFVGERQVGRQIA